KFPIALVMFSLNSDTVLSRASCTRLADYLCSRFHVSNGSEESKTTPLTCLARHLGDASPFFSVLQSTALVSVPVQRAHLVMHDFGGPWGLAWAAANPEAVLWRYVREPLARS